MGLQSVVPGRYTSSVVDWGISEVERLDGALEAWIKFDFKDQAGQMQSIVWKSLILTKAGERNKKTFSTLAVCGREDGDMIKFMEPDGLNTSEMVDITIDDEVYGEKTYKVVAWVNKLGGGQRNKPEGEAKLSLEQKLAHMGLGKIPHKKAQPKNYAPGSESPGSDDELKF